MGQTAFGNLAYPGGKEMGGEWREACIELVQLPKSLCIQLEVTELLDLESTRFSTIHEMRVHGCPEQNETENLTPCTGSGLCRKLLFQHMRQQPCSFLPPVRTSPIFQMGTAF